MASLALMVPPTLPRWKHLCSYNTQIRNETKRDGYQRKVLKLIARPDEEQEKGMRYIYMVRDRDRDRALGPRVRNAGYEERRSQFRQRNRLQKATEAFQARVPCVLFTLRRWELQDTRWRCNRDKENNPENQKKTENIGTEKWSDDFSNNNDNSDNIS